MRIVWARAFSGIVGGLAGAWVMQQFRIRWDARSGATEQSGIFGFDKEADLNSVDELCSALSLAPLSEADALRAALVLHYGYGAAAGALYTMWKPDHWTKWRPAGVLFGAVLWLIGDEAAITVSGLSDPRSKSPAAHWSALAVHLLFGVTVDSTIRLI
jgi:hypothetical protein